MKTENMPEIELVGRGAWDRQSALCLLVAKDQTTANLQDPLRSAVESTLRSKEFGAEIYDTLLSVVALSDGTKARIVFTGLGETKDLDHIVLERAVASAIRTVRASGIPMAHIVPPAVSDKVLSRAMIEAVIEALYDGDLYREKDEESTLLKRVTIELDHIADKESIKREAGIIASSVNFTRALSDQPSNSLTPEEFAKAASDMAAECNLKVETLYADDIQRLGMGGLWGIGRGSVNRPVMIVLRYEPEKVLSDEVLAFVGKGITFDTGGISIKPAKDMHEMKADMAGGAAVLGAMRAISQLKFGRKVLGIVPSAENMPSGSAIRPGDVVRTFSGMTIEVVDTDAEGRVVLSDGLAYARHLGATHIVDLATLTGSIIIALGDLRTGLFGNDEEWIKRVEQAAERAREKVWRMPVSDDYKKRIESQIADFKNYGGRPDAIAAALLLSKFADNTPWVHLDIAGTAWYDDAMPYAPQGSTGAGVKTLVELARLE